MVKGISRELIGIIGYSIAEGWIDQMVGQFGGAVPGVSADMIELALGWYLKKRRGIVGSIGKAMFTINLYNVAKTFTGGLTAGFGV